MPNESEYLRKARLASPPSPRLKNCALAFVSGGAVCALGQAVNLFFAEVLQKDELTASTLTSVTLIVAAAALTGLGVFDKIAKFALAGALVPITGFSNAVVSCALEFSSEGRIFGTGARMFNIAGPVIVYGTAASSLYGVIYLLTKLF